MLASVILELVKAGLTAGLTLLAALLQRRKDLRDLKSGKKTVSDLQK